jgi:hypothetical protein
MFMLRHILQIIVQLRASGGEPVLPDPADTLLRYAQRLEQQLRMVRAYQDPSTMYDAFNFAQFLICLFGLEQAAEPLPPQLLALFFSSMD